MFVLSRRFTQVAVALALTVTTVPAMQSPANAGSSIALADLESAVLGHSCPMPETIVVLRQSPMEADNAATILREATIAGSPLIGALFDTYWSGRDGVRTSTDTYDLVDFASCFANGLDVAHYEEQLRRAVEYISDLDEQVQTIVDNGAERSTALFAR